MTVSVGLYNQLADRSNSFQQRMKAISLYNLCVPFTEYNPDYDRDIIQNDNIDDIILEAYKRKSLWVIIFSYGVRILHKDIISKMINYCLDNQYYLAGHILEDQSPNNKLNYFSLHHQCCIIHLPTWNDVGRPKFGNNELTNGFVTLAERSKDNYHDDYTPHWLKPSKDKISLEFNRRQGWNIISAFLAAEKTVGNLDWDIRNLKAHLYPEIDNNLEKYLNGEEVELSTDSQIELVNGISKIENISKTFFYFNTDHFEDYKEFNNLDNKCNSIYSVASGFFSLHLLKKSNWDLNTKVIYFDFSQVALDFKKYLIENWDGQDYDIAIKNFITSYKHEVKPLWHTGINFLSGNIPNEFYDQWDKTVEYFGGKENWLTFWNDYKKLEHQYHRVNIIEDSSSLTDIIDKNKNNDRYDVVWFSNCFNTSESVLYFSPDQLNESYYLLTEDIINKANKTLVFGFPPILYNEYTR